jgi:hypothetical protein
MSHRESSIDSSTTISFQTFFENYGWGIVISALALNFLRNYFIRLLKPVSKVKVDVNLVKREAFFDSEVKRVRVYQQLDVYRANRDANLQEEGLSGSTAGLTKYFNKANGLKK